MFSGSISGLTLYLGAYCCLFVFLFFSTWHVLKVTLNKIPYIRIHLVCLPGYTTMTPPHPACASYKQPIISGLLVQPTGIIYYFNLPSTQVNWNNLANFLLEFSLFQRKKKTKKGSFLFNFHGAFNQSVINISEVLPEWMHARSPLIVFIIL